MSTYQNMYPAVANSPEVLLIEAVTATDTTLKFDGPIPAAPNLLVLGNREDCETILYTQYDSATNTITQCERGYEGVAKAWDVNTPAARNFTAYDHDMFLNNIDFSISKVNALAAYAQGRLDTATTATLTLPPGAQAQLTTKDAPANVLSTVGRTSLNVHAKGDSLYYQVNVDVGLYLDFAEGKPLYNGNKSLRLYANGSGEHRARIRAYDLLVGGEQCYFVYAMVNVPRNSQVRFRTSITAGGLEYNLGTPMTATYTRGEFVPVCGVAKAPAFAVGDGDDVRGNISLMNASGQLSYDANGEEFYVGATGCIPISHAEYDAFHPGIAGQYAAKYITMEPIAPITNPYIHRFGENMMPPLHMAIMHTPTAAVREYDWFNPVGGRAEHTAIPIDVEPQTWYTIKAFSMSGARHAVYGCDFNDTTPPAGWNVGDTLTFNSGINTRLLYLIASANPTTSEASLSGIMMVAGTVAPTTFKPREDSFLVFQTKLYADPTNGGNPDELVSNDGNYYKISRWYEQELNVRDMTWSFVQHGSNNWGYFIGTIPVPFASWSKPYLRVFNGHVIKNTDYYSDYRAYWENGKITWRTGLHNWSSSYMPTQEEINAFIMGWGIMDVEATAGSTGWPSLYDRTDGLQKGWYPLNNPFDPAARITNGVVPMDPPPNWKGNSLFYARATIAVEPVPTYGSMDVIEGTSYIKTGSGAVVREKIIPQYSNGEYFFNVLGLLGSRTKYPPDKIISVDDGDYANTAAWKYGGQPYTIAGAGVGGLGVGGQTIVGGLAVERAHYVTYIPSYWTPGPNAWVITYPTTEKALFQSLARIIRRQEESLSALKTAEITPPFIRPTVLNGWRFYGGDFSVPGYYRDHNDRVYLKGLLKDGIGTMFILPEGYRPKEMLIFIVEGGGAKARVDVMYDGQVVLNSGNNGYVSLDGISFRAQQ